MVSRLTQLSSRHYILFWALVLSILTVISFYFISNKYLLMQKKENLISIVDERMQQIKEFVQGSEKSIYKVFEQPKLRALIDDIVEQGATDDVQQKSALFEQYTLLLKSYSGILNYKNCVLFDTKGRVIFTDTPVYENLSLESKSLQESELGDSIQQVLMTLTTDIAEFSYDPLLKAPAFFITVPLFKDQKLQCIAAIRFNEEDLYDITDNYIGLGATGDLNISKRIPTGFIYLNKVRNELVAPFKKFLPLSYTTITGQLSPTQLACLGYSGSAERLDSRNIWSVVAWHYVPRVNFGMAAKISYEEVLKPLLLYKNFIYFFLLFLLILLVCALWYDSVLHKRMHDGLLWLHNLCSQEYQVRKIIYIAWGLSLVCVSSGIYYLYALKKEVITNKQQEISSKIADAKQQIEHILYTAELITQTLSYNIRFGRIKKENLIARLEQHITENPIISGISVAYAPYAADKNKRLFGRYVTRTATGIKTFNLDELYDYTTETDVNAPYKIFYLDSFIKRGIVWLDPKLEYLSGRFVTACSNDIYTANDEQTLVGVVTIFIDMSKINKIIESINLNETGTSYLVSHDGVFLYHPSLDYEHHKTTIVEMAQTSASPELITLWKKRLEGFSSYNDVSEQQQKLIYFMPIERTGWFLSMIFPETVMLPSLMYARHSYILVLFLSLFFTCCTLIILFRVYKKKNRTTFSKFFILSIPLFLSLVLLMYISYSNQTFQSGDKHTITTPLEVQQFLMEKNEIARIVNEEIPIPIVTGIEVESLQAMEKGGIKISGLIWQYYNEVEHKGIQPGVFFTEASGKVDLIKTYETKLGTTTIIGWKFFIDLPYEWNEKVYPLDINEISIVVEHPDLSRNILLTPDFSAYQNMRPQALPALTTGISMLGFDIQSSSFSFRYMQPKTTYGVEPFGQSTTYYVLSLDIIAVRNIMNAILVYFLPIFIILFAIYVFFIMNENKTIDVEKTLTAYTGILLTIVFLHRGMRDQRVTSNVMFIEYFFLLTYVTLFILFAHGLLQQTQFYKKEEWYRKLVHLYRIFFWDIQMALSLVITTILFY